MHPEDFSLLQLGEFDDQSGRFVHPMGYPMHLGTAVSLQEASRSRPVGHPPSEPLSELRSMDVPNRVRKPNGEAGEAVS